MNTTAKIPLALSKVAELWNSLGMTRREFSVAYGIPEGTLQDWESGRKMPVGVSKSYLQVISQEPHAVRAAFQKSQEQRRALAN